MPPYGGKENRTTAPNGKSIKKKALQIFSFPLEGNASKKQRVYEGKNDEAAPLLF